LKKSVFFVFMFNTLKVKYFIGICFVSSFISGSHAQIIGTELDAYESTDSLYAVRNAFKIDPLQIIVGDLPFLYERFISKNLSIELGCGFTRRNFLSPFFEYDLDNLSRNVKIKSQPSYKIALRYYFDSNEELDGFYIAAEYNYRTHKKNFFELDTLGNTNGKIFVDKRIYNDAKLILGRQILSSSSNLVIDYYLGLGYRKKELHEVHQLQGQNQIFYYERKERENFAFFIGVKLGFGF
jgi:hypothetical protein